MSKLTSMKRKALEIDVSSEEEVKHVENQSGDFYDSNSLKSLKSLKSEDRSVSKKNVKSVAILKEKKPSKTMLIHRKVSQNLMRSHLVAPTEEDELVDSFDSESRQPAAQASLIAHK